MRRALLLCGALAVAVSACAYFNALYNARRHYADAERAAARGDLGTAHANYGTAIEKAAKSLRRDPDGRWADDALYLIGRAHFARGDYRQATAALERLVRETDDADILTGAYAYLGAAAVRLGEPAAALPRLDSAVTRAGNDGDLAAFAYLWRARARFALADEAGAWPDVEAAAAIGGGMGRDARLEWATRAVQLDQPDRAAAAFAALFGDKDAHLAADSVEALAARAGQRWGGGQTAALLDGVNRSAWPPAARDALRLRRAELLAAAGDSAEAVREARAIADRAAGATADRARVALARWALARAQEISDLDEVRNLLLPAIANADARRLLQDLKALAVLVEFPAEVGQPLALFAAAELARDELGAPRIARSLFVAYADLAPTTLWAPKALLAALAIDPAAEDAPALRRRLDSYAGNVYLAAVSGGAPGTPYERAETALDSALGSLLRRAREEADRRDALVVQAQNRLDSLRAQLRADSLATGCNALLDSLGVAGIRADSLRAACLRADSLRMDSLLTLDTLLLLPDSLRPDSLRADSLRRDTL